MARRPRMTEHSEQAQLALDLDDPYLVDEIDAPCNARGIDPVERYRLAEAMAVPWWDLCAGEPGCLFDRRPRTRRVA